MTHQDGQLEPIAAFPDTAQPPLSEADQLLRQAALFAGKLLPLLDGMKLYLAPDQDEERRENFAYESYGIFYDPAANVTTEAQVYANLKDEPQDGIDGSDDGVIVLAGDDSAEDLPREITFGRSANLGYVALHLEFYEGMYHGVLSKENGVDVPGPTRAGTDGKDSLGQVQLSYRPEASSITEISGFVRAVDASALTPEMDTTIALETFTPLLDTSEVLPQVKDYQAACRRDKPA
jgi:hypothetical protein